MILNLVEDTKYHIFESLPFKTTISLYGIKEYKNFIDSNLNKISDIYCLPYIDNFYELSIYGLMSIQELFNYALITMNYRLIYCMDIKYEDKIIYPLSINKWINYAGRKNLLLKWSDIIYFKKHKMNPLIVSSLDQGYYSGYGLLYPRDAFEKHLDNLVNIDWFFEGNYEKKGLAVTGSGNDSAILLSILNDRNKMSEMPLVNIFDEDYDDIYDDIYDDLIDIDNDINLFKLFKYLSFDSLTKLYEIDKYKPIFTKNFKKIAKIRFISMFSEDESVHSLIYHYFKLSPQALLNNALENADYSVISYMYDKYGDKLIYK